MKINESLIEPAYQIAQRYYSAKGGIRITDAKNELASLGANPNSAVDMIYNFKHLLDGERYTRKLSVIATEAYLKWIERDYEMRFLRNAISALRQHIEYYRTLTGTPMSGHVTLLAKYDTRFPVGDSFFSSPEEASNDERLLEGRTKTIYVDIYERNQKARKQCIDFYGLSCRVCNFDFEARYGALGKGFIHVHHVVDLASIKKEYEIDPIKDLRPVCPNCHAMLHKSKPAYPIYKLRKLIRKK